MQEILVSLHSVIWWWWFAIAWRHMHRRFWVVKAWVSLMQARQVGSAVLCKLFSSCQCWATKQDVSCQIIVIVKVPRQSITRSPINYLEHVCDWEVDVPLCGGIIELCTLWTSSTSTLDTQALPTAQLLHWNLDSVPFFGKPPIKWRRGTYYFIYPSFIGQNWACLGIKFKLTLMMTRWAGVFTPQAKVDVATRIWEWSIQWECMRVYITALWLWLLCSSAMHFAQCMQRSAWPGLDTSCSLVPWGAATANNKKTVHISRTPLVHHVIVCHKFTTTFEG